MNQIFYYDQALDEYCLQGVIIFEQITELLAVWERIRPTSPKSLTINCAGIEKADSSFLAFLIEMRRWAHEHHQPWHLKKLPLFLKGFLSVYGIEEFLKSDQFITPT